MAIVLADIVGDVLALIDSVAIWDRELLVYQCGRITVSEHDMAELRREVSLRAYTWIATQAHEQHLTAGYRGVHVLALPIEPMARVHMAVRLAWNGSALRAVIRLPEV